MANVSPRGYDFLKELANRRFSLNKEVSVGDGGEVIVKIGVLGVKGPLQALLDARHSDCGIFFRQEAANLDGIDARLCMKKDERNEEECDDSSNRGGQGCSLIQTGAPMSLKKGSGRECGMRQHQIEAGNTKLDI